MLSTLPKLADRSFILGFFLPTLLFSVVVLILFQDLPPAREWLLDLAAKEISKAAYVLLIVWVMAVALLMLNHPLYRFLEGYTFPSWLAEPLKKRKRKRLQDALSEIATLFQRAATEGEQFPSLERQRYRVLKRDTTRVLPSTASDVLPTDFGNAIRAFELYPRDIYGADGVWLWLRLGTVLPKEFVEQIQDTRTQVDFLVNCCLFSLVTSALAIGRIAAAASQQLTANTPLGSWVMFAAGGLLAAHLFYRWAVSRVPAWGDCVMTAYDCYLPSLAKQLGYALPATEAGRKAFWTAFSQQVIYGRDPNGSLAYRVEDWIKSAEKSKEDSSVQAIIVSVDVSDDSR